MSASDVGPDAEGGGPKTTSVEESASGGTPAAQMQRNALEMLVDHLPDAVSLHDAEGTYLYASDVFTDAFGFPSRLAVRALCHNAVKHTPVGTNVWIRVEPHPDGRLLVVEDDGPGVPDRMKSAIFDRLAHGDHEHTHPDPGLGLGLYLVDQIAKAHGGQVWVQDRDGGGASFRVLLPVTRRQAAAPGALDADHERGHRSR